MRIEKSVELNDVRVLDHGYIKFIECWGSDQRIVEAARMSTDKGFIGWGEPGVRDGDEKLLKFLWEHKHYTPFEMAGMTIEVQAPIFVFREWHRHRTQSYNELSARYTPLPNLNYIPKFERCLLTSSVNKQAGVVAPANDGSMTSWLRRLESFYEAAENMYQDGLAAGVPKELARIVVPVGRYSRMRASANLRNWLAFLSLRLPENAQWEIRQYASLLNAMISQAFPRVWEIFNDDK